MTIPKYRFALLATYLVCFVTIWGLAYYLYPLEGDLTRVGGFSENLFLPQDGQTTFQKNAFVVAKSLADYNRDYDVLVLGDSFSCDQVARGFGWQNYFWEKTGYSVIVFDMRRFWPQEILASEEYRKHPPKIFIFESVERYLHERTAYFSEDAILAQLPESKEIALPAFHPAQGIEKTVVFPKREACQDVSYVVGFLGAKAQRWLGINEQAKVFPLKTDGLFSSKEKRSLLVYFDEIKKKNLDDAELQKAREGIYRLKKLVESNGVTRFFCLVAPDKTSIFSEFLENPENRTRNIVEFIAEDKRLPMIRADVVLSQAIRQGKRDIYLPNDCHWNSEGNRLVGEEAARVIKSKTGSQKFENSATD